MVNNYAEIRLLTQRSNSHISTFLKFLICEAVKAFTKTRIRYPAISCPKSLHPGTTNTCLKPKELGGALHLLRGTCSVTRQSTLNFTFTCYTSLYTSVVRAPLKAQKWAIKTHFSDVRSQCSLCERRNGLQLNNHNHRFFLETENWRRTWK